MVIIMFIQTIALALISLVVLFILTKIMGYRQITQLSMYDYIIGITIGSIASEMVVLTDFKDVYRPLIGMLIYALFTVSLSLSSRRSLKLRHFIEGNPITLYKDDRIINKALAKAKMDINELLMQLRIQGYFDITQIDQVTLETNGNVSVYPKSQYRPVIVDDLEIAFKEEKPLIALMIDSQLLEKQLEKIQQDQKWFDSQLKVNGFSSYDNVLLVLCDNEKNLTIYPKK